MHPLAAFSRVLTSPRRAPIARWLTAGLVVLFASAPTSLAFQGSVQQHTTGKQAPPSLVVPEINPALAGGTILLLVGGVLILTSRRRPARQS